MKKGLIATAITATVLVSGLTGATEANAVEVHTYTQSAKVTGGVYMPFYSKTTKKEGQVVQGLVHLRTGNAYKVYTGYLTLKNGKNLKVQRGIIYAKKHGKAVKYSGTTTLRYKKAKTSSGYVYNKYQIKVSKGKITKFKVTTSSNE